MLALIGDGPLRGQITELVSKLGLEKNVIFTGRPDSKGVLSWLQAGDVFTLISAVEGLPCSVLEAMSTGMPSVVHGLITESGNQDSIARGLVRVLADPELSKALGGAAAND